MLVLVFSLGFSVGPVLNFVMWVNTIGMKEWITFIMAGTKTDNSERLHGFERNSYKFLSTYKGVCIISGTGAAIYTAIVVARCHHR
jgi:hypothetical protein